MPIDPSSLARNLSKLAVLDAEDDLAGAMQQLASDLGKRRSAQRLALDT